MAAKIQHWINGFLCLNLCLSYCVGSASQFIKKREKKVRRNQRSNPMADGWDTVQVRNFFWSFLWEVCKYIIAQKQLREARDFMLKENLLDDGDLNTKNRLELSMSYGCHCWVLFFSLIHHHLCIRLSLSLSLSKSNKQFNRICNSSCNVAVKLLP